MKLGGELSVIWRESWVVQAGASWIVQAGLCKLVQAGASWCKLVQAVGYMCVKLAVRHHGMVNGWERGISVDD
jgi:hypothetical protein